MHVEIRFHSDHIAPNDLAIFKALAALAEFAPDTPLPTAEADHGEPLRPEYTPLVEVKPAPEPEPIEAKPAPAPEPEPIEAKPAPAPEPEPIEAKPAEEPTETKLAAAKRELTEEVTKLARSGPEGRAKAKKALISAGVERVSEVKTLTVAKAVLAALAEDDEADDLA